MFRIISERLYENIHFDKCNFLFNIHPCGVSLHEFKNLITIFHQEYDQELALKKEVFKINQTGPGMDPDMWWNIPTPRASYSSYTENGTKVHLLFLFGGYARIEGMTIEGVANTLERPKCWF